MVQELGSNVVKKMVKAKMAHYYFPLVTWLTTSINKATEFSNVHLHSYQHTCRKKGYSSAKNKLLKQKGV